MAVQQETAVRAGNQLQTEEKIDYATEHSSNSSYVQYYNDPASNAQYNRGYEYGHQEYTCVPHDAYQDNMQEYPGYMDEYGQFIPLQHDGGYQEYASRGYHNNRGGYPSYRGGRRPRRGRGAVGGYDNRYYGGNQGDYQYGYQDNGDYHYNNTYDNPQNYEQDVVEGKSDTNPPTGAKPKQFSYQRNRYRENRQQRTANAASDNVDAKSRSATKSYSQMRARKFAQAGLGTDKAMESTKGEETNTHVSDADAKTYSQTTHDLSETDNIQDTLSRYPTRIYANKRGSYGNPSPNSTQERNSGRSDRRGRDTDDTNSKPSANEKETGFVHLTSSQHPSDKLDQNSRREVDTRSESPRDSDNNRTAKYVRERWREGSTREVVKPNAFNGAQPVPNRSRDTRSTGRTDYGRSSTSAKSGDYSSAKNNKDGNKDSPRLRQGDDNAHKFKFNNKKKFFKKGGEDVETQRGALIEQLGNNTYECMVCCDVVRRETAVWSCTNCYHVFHLRCVKKWARSPAAAIEGQAGWRCPACQNVCTQMPTQYRCFCTRVKDPEHSRYETPHSCGEVCRKKRGEHCNHLCNILCHPGPCPECQASVTRHCFCGKSKMALKCSQSSDVTCQEECRKTLNCGRHECVATCHKAACEPCTQVVAQECYCGKEKREVVCGTTESFTTSFCCEKACNRKLTCDNHVCDTVCHPGSCDQCRLLPEVVRYCACLKTPLDEITTPGEERQTCLDPIPTCDKPCEKELKCGPKDSPHKCDKKCHADACGPCALQTEIRCRCGALDKMVPCADIDSYTGVNEFRCDKRCNKKRECGRHRCQHTCCTEEEHSCDLVCNKRLTCGLHRCEEPCHRGNCPRCWQASFDELSCFCGTEVIMPPVPCGTRPPECRNPCTRPHLCGHEARHPCHSEENCPLCPQLTEKWCMGKHELRKNIQCHVTDVSCGMRCNRLLSCSHKCQLVCHRGDCEAHEKACTQPCAVIRTECGHPCALQCHGDSPCPSTQCRAQVTLTCDCGNRTEKAYCQLESRNSQEYHRMAASMLAMNRMDGETIDISDLTKTNGKPRKLECSSDCAIKERNKRLANALEINNPDITNKPGTSYTDYLKDYAKRNSTFSASVEKAMSDLVLSAQKSAHKARSHSFTTMRNDQRKFIHELAEYYGCATQSYDEEPQRNVVATAVKDKCYRPSVTLTALTQRELHPKAPMPIPHRSSEQQIRSSMQASKQSTKVLGSWGVSTPRAASATKPTSSMTTLSKKPAAWSSDSNSPRQTTDSKTQPLNPWSSTSKSKSGEKVTTKTKEPVVDYFDMTD